MEYKVIYSRRKTIAISIVDCGVVVKAPIGTGDKTLREVVAKHSQWIAKAMEKQAKKQALYKALTDEDIKLLKKAAKKYFMEKTAYYAKIMGIDYGRITITSAKTRFGSCSSLGNIAYSYRLMLYPEPAREYVVVHELAHRKQMNHSAKFYAIIESVLPDYKTRKRLLK